VLALTGCLSVTIAAAAEITVFSAGAVEPGLARLADTFRRDTGNVVRVEAAVPAVLQQRIEAGATPDVIVAPPVVVDALVRAGRVQADGRTPVGRVGVGVTVRDGAPLPDLSSPDRLKEALLATEVLVYNRASTGTYFERLLERLGIAEQVRGKTVRYPDGAAVLEHVLRGTGRELGIGAITEIRAFEARGLRLVGPLPPDLQNYTSYVAGVLTTAPSPDVARAFIGFATSPTAKAVFAATGVE